MAGNLTVDFERVARFVLPRSGATLCQGMRAIGYERDGAVVAGFLFEHYDGQNVWAHAAFESPHDLTRSLLRALLRYVYVELGCARMWACLCAENTRSVRFVEHLGAARIAVLPQADGDRDRLVYRLDSADVRSEFFS
jgi:RimJ/RimL family protein N-acetyltransferase